MKYRKLRIAWSVTCAVLCLSLIGLLIRSYTVADIFFLRTSPPVAFGATSDEGGLLVTFNTSPVQIAGMIPWHGSYTPGPKPSRKMWAYGPIPNGGYIQAPQLMFIFTAAFAAAAPWLPLQFSLRTLLIVTTLVAVGLGVVVWEARG